MKWGALLGNVLCPTARSRSNNFDCRLFVCLRWVVCADVRSWDDVTLTILNPLPLEKKKKKVKGMCGTTTEMQVCQIVLAST